MESIKNIFQDVEYIDALIDTLTKHSDFLIDNHDELSDMLNVDSTAFLWEVYNIVDIKKRFHELRDVFIEFDDKKQAS